MTLAPSQRLNSRGRPCTSLGRRNSTAIGTGLGNGGVTPPRYQRRRDATGSGRHPRSFREHWRRVLSHLLNESQIDPVTFAIGYALTEFSNERAESVWPAQATIGKRVGRSASTVNRRLRRLRDLGMLEWDHRFDSDTTERKGIRGTSNFYEFRIPDELMHAAGLPRQRQHQRPDRSRRHSSTPAPGNRTPTPHEWQREIDSTAAALARSAATFEVAHEEIESLYANQGPERASYARTALDDAWKQFRAPPQRSDE